MIFNYSKAIFFILVMMPFSALTKIYISFDYTPLLFEFILILLLTIGLIKYLEVCSTFIFSLMVCYFLFCVLTWTYSDIPRFIDQAMAFRLTGLAIIGFFLPFVIRFNEQNLDFFYKLMFVVGCIIFVNALRQSVYPFASEVRYADLAGGALKFLGDEFQGGQGAFRAFSVFLTSVHLVIYCCLLLYLATSIYFMSVNRSNLVKMTIVLSAMAAVATYSRTGWLSLVAGFLPLLYMMIMTGDISSRLRNILVFMFLAFLIIAVGSQSELVVSRFSTLNDVTEVSSFNSRMLLWEDRIEDFYNNPNGLGIGAAGWNMEDVMHSGADSNYIKFFLELGWFGGLFSILILSMCLVYSTKVFMHIMNNKIFNVYTSFYTAFYCFYLASLVQMVTNQMLEANPLNFYFWFVFGSLFVMGSLVYRRQ
jgi:hypothetical protein